MRAADYEGVEVYEIDASEFLPTLALSTPAAEAIDRWHAERSTDDLDDDDLGGDSDDEYLLDDDSIDEDEEDWEVDRTWMDTAAWTLERGFGGSTSLHDDILVNRMLFGMTELVSVSDGRVLPAPPLGSFAGRTADTLLVAGGTMDGEDGWLAAVDRWTGATRWSTNTGSFVPAPHVLDSVFAGSLAILPLVEHNTRFAILAIDTTSGSELWRLSSDQPCMIGRLGEHVLLGDIRGAHTWSRVVEAATGEPVTEWKVPFVPRSAVAGTESTDLWYLPREVDDEGWRKATKIDGLTGEIIEWVQVKGREASWTHGVFAAATDNGFVRVHDGKTTNHGSGFTPIHFGDGVVVATTETRLAAWDLVSGARRFDIAKESVSNGEWTPPLDGNSAVFESDGDLVVHCGERVVILDGDTGELRQSLSVPGVWVSLEGVGKANDERFAILQDLSHVVALPMIGPVERSLRDALGMLDDVTNELSAGDQIRPLDPGPFG